MGNVSTNNSKHIVTSRQPLAALEPAKPLTHSFYCAQLWLRETKCGWSSDTREQRRNGGGLAEASNSVLCGEGQCVLCVDQ